MIAHRPPLTGKVSHVSDRKEKAGSVSIVLVIPQPNPYYSYMDEKHFFSWLEEIDEVSRVTGIASNLEVELEVGMLSDDGLADLIALFYRYRLDMQCLRQFENEGNTAWLRSEDAYWHEPMFGAEVPRGDR